MLKIRCSKVNDNSEASLATSFCVDNCKRSSCYGGKLSRINSKFVFTRFKDFPKCVAILFRNPTYIFESLAIALDSLIITGMAVFGAKYLETQFGLDPSDAGTYFGEECLVGYG